MIQVRFKGLRHSEFLFSVIHRRVGALVEKFPDLAISRVRVTVEMENSPLKRGPDLFHVKMTCSGGRFRNIVLSKKGINPNIALAEAIDKMLERLNRFGDKLRVQNFRRERALKRETQTIEEENSEPTRSSG